MKKFLKIMTAAAILLCGLSLTGCQVAAAVKESVNDSYKTWYKYKSTKTIDIPVLSASDADEDTTAESTQKLKNAEIYFYFDPDLGLKVAVQSVTRQDVELLSGLYKKQVDIVMGATKQFALNDFGKVKWTALWSSGKIEKASEPKISSNPNECIVLGEENKPKIQWKKFLANYLLDKLLDD